MFLSVHGFPVWEADTIDRVWVGSQDRFQALIRDVEEGAGSPHEGLFSRESVGDRRAGSLCVPE
jgi:hypothetical protein